jgi:hypothetical protein
MAGIHARWEHGHDGLTVDCALCGDERAEVAALTAVNAPPATRAADRTTTARP